MDMITEIQKIFGGNLVCIAEFGKEDSQIVIILDQIDSHTLNSAKKNLQDCFKKTKKFPLLLTKEELMDGMDVFPLDFLNMKLNHKILFGEDILNNLKFDKKHIRRQLEFEFRSKLINLRQSYLVVKSNKELKLIIESSIPTLLPMLNGLLFLKGKKVPNNLEDIFNLTEKEYKLNISALSEIKRNGHLDKEEAIKKLVDLLSKLSHILDEMNKVMPKPNDISPYAPRIMSIMINPEKIGALIGPGGKNIKKIIEDTTCEVNVDDDGLVTVAGENTVKCNEALDMVKALTFEPEVGMEFEGKVTRLMSFGAFVEFVPGREGMVHISELEWARVEKVEDVLKPGDQVRIKLIKIDDQGRLDFSRRALLEKPEGYVERPKKPRGDRKPFKKRRF